MKKVTGCLNEYPLPEYNLYKIKEIFYQMKIVLNELKVNVEKGKYEIENYFIRYCFVSDKN